MKKIWIFPFFVVVFFNFYFKHKFVRTNSGYFGSFCFCLFSLYFLLCFLFIVLNLYKANKRVCIVFFSYSNGKIVSFALFCYYFPFKLIEYLEKILHLIWNVYVSVWRLIWSVLGPIYSVFYWSRIDGSQFVESHKLWFKMIKKKI